MKKLLLWAVLPLLVCFPAFAQTGPDTAGPKMAFGLGPEWNMNSRNNFAAGAAMSFDYNALPDFAVGAVFSASYNFNGFSTLEPVFLLRYYFPSSDSFFIQTDMGAFIFFEDGDVTPLFLVGLRGGLRIPLGSYYVEPYGRIGYPFAFGFGVMAGILF